MVATFRPIPANKMPIQIQVPGKGIAEFPDDVSYDDAFKAIQEDVPDFQPSRADIFAKLQRQSEAFAAPDRARFARQLGVTAEPSGFDRIASSAASAARGVANFVPGAIGLAGGVQEGLGFGNQINERVRKPLEGFIEDTFPVDPETTTGTVGLLTTGVAGGAGQLVSSLMPGGFFKNAPKLANLASSLMGGAQEFTDAWDRERERQKQAGEDDPLKALIKSGGYAAIATALESKLGPGHLAEKLAELGKGKVNNIIASAFKNAAAGGAEEFLQRIAQDLIVESKPDWKAAAGEGLVGAIVQGGAGTTIDAANNIATVKAAERKAAYENWLSNQAAEKAKLDTIREQSANELAEMAGFEKPHTIVRQAQPIPETTTDAGFVDIQQPGGLGIVERLRQSERARKRANVEAGLVGPATEFPSTPITEQQSTSGIGEVVEPSGYTAIDAAVSANARNKARIPAEAGLTDVPVVDESTSTPFDSALLYSKPQKQLPEIHPAHAAALNAAMNTLDAMSNPETRGLVTSEDVSDLSKLAPVLLRVLNARVDKAIELNSPDSVLDKAVSERDRIAAFVSKISQQPQTPNPLGGESANGQIQKEKGLLTQPATPSPSIKTEGAPIESNPPDKIDAALSRAIEATNPFGKANTGNLGVTYTVLKLTRAAYRAGKSLAIAIKESIAQYRAANPAAQFNDDEVDAAVRIKLQDFLAGGEDALAIAKAAEPAVAENERAAAMIHAEEYHRQRISDRRKELNRLHDQAVQQALGNGIDVALVPKVTSSEFPEFAASLGMDAGLIQQLQGDVAREAKARRLSELQTQSEEIGRTITTLTGLDPTKYEPLIAQLVEGKQKLDKRIARKGFDDARVRAAEILDHTREFVSRKARLEALNNPDVKEAISGPVQVLRDLMAEYPDLRDRGVSDWVSDPNITDEVKRVVVARLSTAFREFDKHHDNVATTLAASEASLERQINRLKERISKGEIRKAYIDIVIEEARLAAAGETGLTGGLGVDHLEWFDANAEALRSFARSLAEKLNGTGQDALDARKLSDWILFRPEDAPPAIKNTAQTNWGVGDETLNEIIKALQESPAVRNAVAAIYDKGTEKLPAHELRRIATIALSGEEADAEFAQYLAKQLQKKQGTELFKVVQRLRTDAKNLLDARVRLETLREALKLFQSVEASPVFKDARIETETQEGSFTRQMFVGNENEITLRGFSGPEINQSEIKIGAGRGGDQNFSSLTKSAVESWRRSANQYITAFDLAQHESDINPLAPHPISLGFDVAVYRGLQSALEETSVLVDPSTYDDDSKIDFYAGLTAQGQSVDFNRQLDAVARMVEGIFGKNFQLKNAWYRNAKLKATRVFHDRKNASIPAMLSKAMASHPTIGGIQWLNSIPRFGPWFNETFAPGGNVEVYRNRVFNQLAHSARGNFVDTPKVGDILPSGEIVTQADLDLLAQSIKYSNDLLKVAQYKRGTVVNVGKTEFRRPVASVGVMGSPRHINKRGWNDFMLGVVSAFDADEGGGVFTSGDDLANGTRPWIQFWNRLALHDDVLTHHVLDSARIDRAITVSPYMKSAYEKLAASLRVNKYENRISNLEDLVEKLRVNFPSGTGVDAREFILSELGKEFGQYVAQSKSKLKSVAGTTLSPEPTTTDTADTRQRSSSIVETETMNNEFTKPAADLVIPSVYYDYSSITPSEMALAKDRAVSEFTVELKHSLREAESSLSAYVASIANDPTKTEDRKRFEFIRDQIHNLDLDIGRDMRKIGGIVRAATGVVSLGVAGALTSPVAAIGNVISSGLPAYIYMSRVSRLGKLAMIASALAHTARATKNLAYVYIDKSVGGAFSSAFKALSKSKNPAMVKVADSITEMLDKGMKMGGFANAADVRATGLSQTDRLLTEIANDMRAVLQFADSSEVAKYSGYSGKARLAGKVAATGITSSLKNFSKMVGLESGDLAVNMSAYQIAKSTEKDLKDLAARWAADRVKRLNGEYNPDNREWDVKPEEWLSGNFNRQMDQQNRLAGLRVQLSESGEQLESALWDYWKRSDGGKKDVEFFKDPDSFRRTVIGAINANILTNRPQKAQTNPEQSMFQTLMNYTSDLAVKIMGAMKTVKSAKGMRKWFDLIMRAVWGAIAALLVGLITGAARDFVGRQTTAKIDRQMTPMDKEFWNADENLPKRLALEAAKVMPFGQSAVNLLALNRPDAASGNFYVSFINSLSSYVMGAARVQKEDLPWLMKRAFVKFFPFSETALSQTSANDPRQINSGVAAAAAAVKMAGLERPSQFANASGQQFTEKTPILAKINEAGMRAQIAREKGDEAGLQAALADIAKEKDRLVKFHKDALIEDNKRRGVTMTDFKVDQESIAAARKDWLSLNPLTKALGHQPTSTEMERISAYLSGDRKAAFDRAWNSYSGLAEFFPNGKGVANEPEMVKQERIAGLGRSGGGLTGGMSAGSLSASLRGGSGGFSVRPRGGVRSRRGYSRLSRGIRSRRRSRGRTRGVRRIRF